MRKYNMARTINSYKHNKQMRVLVCVCVCACVCVRACVFLCVHVCSCVCMCEGENIQIQFLSINSMLFKSTSTPSSIA